MKLTIERKKLLAAVSDVGIAVQPKAHAPHAQWVVISATHHGVVVVADSGDVRANCVIDHKPEATGSVMVRHSMLTAILLRESEMVSLESNRLNLNIKSGSLKATLPGDDTASFPLARSTDALQAFVMLDASAGRHMVLCSNYAGDGKSHPWNVGLSMSDNGENAYVIGADARQFGISKLPSAGCGQYELLIPAKLGGLIGKRVCAADSATMSIYPSHVSFSLDNMVVDVMQMQDKYGAVVQMTEQLDDKLTSCLTVPVEPMLAAVRTAAAQLGPQESGIRLKIGQSGIIVETSSKATGSQYSEAVEAENKKGESVDIIINPAYLTQFLSSCDKEQAELRYGADTPAILMNEVSSDHAWYCALIREVAQ